TLLRPVIVRRGVLRPPLFPSRCFLGRVRRPVLPRVTQYRALIDGAPVLHRLCRKLLRSGTKGGAEGGDTGGAAPRLALARVQRPTGLEFQHAAWPDRRQRDRLLAAPLA